MSAPNTLGAAELPSKEDSVWRVSEWTRSFIRFDSVSTLIVNLLGDGNYWWKVWCGEDEGYVARGVDESLEKAQRASLGAYEAWYRYYAKKNGWPL